MPEHAVIFGPAQPGSYSQSLVSGQFSVVLHTSNDSGREILRHIEDIISQNVDISPTELIQKLDPDIDVIIGKITEEKLILSASGRVSAKIVRKAVPINLLPTNNQLPLSHVAGPIQPGDVIILGTTTFFLDLFDYHMVLGKPVVEIRDDLSLKLEAVDNKSEVAAIILKVETPEPVPAISFPSVSLKKPIFLKNQLISTPPRRLLYVSLITLIFLISLIAFQLRSRGMEQRRATIASLTKQAQTSLDSAKKMAGLNDIIARDTLLQAKNDLTTRARESLGADWQKDFADTLSALDNQLATVSHMYKINSLDTFSDFNLLRADANITSAALNQNEIMALDSNNGAIYSLGTKSKTAAIVGGAEDFKKDSYIDFNGDKVYVVAPTGIVLINRANNSNRFLFKNSEKWQNIRGLRAFAGNIYLLDTGASQIWKYQGTDLGFEDAAPYLKGNSVDFSKVVGFSIEGSIFVLSASGNVVKLSGGSPEDFTVTGLDKPLSNPSSIFVTDETENLYILDPGNSRVVILDKQGVYQAQYLLPEVSGQLLADETVKKIFLISGSKVYSFDLRDSPN